MCVHGNTLNPRPLPEMVKLLLLSAFVAFSQCSSHAFEIKGISPVTGPPGTVITVNGEGFEPAKAYSASIVGRVATVRNITAAGLEVVVPAGAASGSIILSDGAGSRTSLEPFVVTRLISGRIKMPDAVGVAGYGVIGYQSITPPVAVSASEATFNIEVPLDQPIALWALRSSDDPPFLALVTSEETEAVIDVNSTVMALALLNPAIAGLDDTKARAFKKKIRDKNLDLEMRTFLQANVRSGISYLQDARYESGMVRLLMEALKPDGLAALSVGNVDPIFPKGTLLKPINRELLLSELTTKLTLKEPTPERPGEYILQVDVGSRFSSLDWFLEVYRLRRLTLDYPNGLASVHAMTFTNRPAFANTSPIAEGFLPAKLDTARVDYFKSIAKWVVSKFQKVFADPNALKSNHLLIPANQPEIYIVQAYSGNIFWRYGGQEYIIDNHDPNSAWSAALAGNAFMASVDFVTIFIDFKKLTGKNDLGFINAQLKDFSKAINAKLRDGQLTGDELLELVTVSARALISNAFSEIAKSAYEEGLFYVFKNTTAAMLSSGLNIFKKIASGLQVIERGGGLILPGRLAVERSVLVVGDPFTPLIRGLSPQSARNGELISIVGQDFPFGTAIVEFCVFADGAGETAEPLKKLAATVVSKSANTIVAQVPLDFETVFSESDRVHIRLTDGVKRGDTRASGLDGRFQYIPPPTLSSVKPLQQIPQGDLTLEGRNFTANSTDQVLLIDGTIVVAPTRVGNNSMNCLLPSTVAKGLHTIAVRLGTNVSKALPFEVVDVPHSTVGLAGGLSIRVTTAAMIDNPDDGYISLLEAMLIARGQLGRPIKEHLPCELLPSSHPSWCKRQVREIDSVSGVGGGALAADTITLSSLPAGQTIRLTAPIMLGTGDRLSGAGAILDASGLPAGESAVQMIDTFGITLSGFSLKNSRGDGVHIQGGGEHDLSLVIEASAGSGLVLDGATANNVISGTVTNSGKHGIHITGGASSNLFRTVRSVGNGLSGMFLEGSARDNKLLEITSRGNGLHGLHLSGAGVQNNRVHGAAPEMEVRGFDLYENCNGYGILIDQGANHNTISALSVKGNQLGGIALLDQGTEGNYVGNAFSRGFPNTPHIRVYENQGPGVYLGPLAQRNVINHISVAGNTGDGVLLEGQDCAFNNIATIWTGYDFFATGGPVPKQNGGNGVRVRAGAHDNQIGSERYPRDYSHRSLFVNNARSGIVVEGAGTDRNRIIRADFGYTLPASYYSANRALFKTNGQDGVTIRGGAKWTILGHENFYFDCHIFGSGQAGVRISGEGTTDSTVMNCHIGYAHGGVNPRPEDKNRFGIVVEQDAKRNFIGVRGDRKSFNAYPFTLEFGNTIANSLEAGIVLGGSRGLFASVGTPGDSNIVQNNIIGVYNFAPPSFGNQVGILITGDAQGNIIGGTLPGTANTIQANEQAGIHIKDNTISDSRLRNIIVGNDISQQGITVTNPPAISILTRTPHGVGVLVSGVSIGNVIGERFDLPNNISQNIAGIFLEGPGVTGTVIRGNLIGVLNGSQPAGGVIVSGGSGTIIGGLGAALANSIVGNGGYGGIVLVEGRRHTIQNNTLWKNVASGIDLFEAEDCMIGGSTGAHANFITENGDAGISMSSTAGNIVQNNYIGTDRAGRRLGNGLQGIYIEDTGGRTIIGAPWDTPPGVDPLDLGNTIAFNRRDGVHIRNSDGVSILHNSISDQAWDGILLGIDANHDLKAPIILSYGTNIVGRVVDLARTPAGSRVQLFSDDDGEGKTFLGQTQVKPDGNWSINGLPVIPFKTITATITIESDHSTSPFGAGFTLVSGFTLRRDGPAAPSTRQLPPNSQRAVVHRLVAEAGDLPVALESLKISTTGSLPEDVAVTSVFVAMDSNRNGEFDAADPELSPRVRFTADGADLVLVTTPFVIPEKSIRKLLIIYEFAQPTRAGMSFDLALTNAAAVVAETVFPVNNRITPLGTFPIRSDLLEFIGSSFNFQVWRSRHFTAAELANPAISGPTANPDGDRLNNALEYALGFDPRTADVQAMPQISKDASGRLVYEYQRRRSAPDLGFNLRSSDDLIAWFTDNRYVQSTDIVALTEETERVRLFLNSSFPHASFALTVNLRE